MSCSELNGRFLSGNLTNLTLYLLKHILHTKAGLTGIQVQPEMKSDTDAAGTRVVYNIGRGATGHLIVEATPDLVLRTRNFQNGSLL